MAQTLLENKLIIKLILSLSFANKAVTGNLGHATAVFRSHINSLKPFNLRGQ